MKKVNKHGLKMRGLKSASGDTKNYGRGCYIQISYNTRTGEVLTDLHCSLGGNSWTEYRDRDITTIKNTSRHMTMQEIADAIAQELDWMQQCADETA
nr:MAG TPA: hypothetical protein [Caudoviricetes sp.]